jgi:hypothetical protein
MSNRLFCKLGSVMLLYLKWFLLLIAIDSAAMKAVHGEAAMLPDGRAYALFLGAFLLSLCDLAIKFLWSE